LVTKLSDEQEETDMSLEDKIHSLEEEGLPREKIAERILEENLDTDVTNLSNLLQLDKLVIGRIKGRLSRLKKLRERREMPQKEEPPSPYKGELDVNAILRDILSKHPDISQKISAEVMDWADRKGGLQPSEVAWILQSMRGITSTTANIIASKYSFALYKAQMEGKLQLPPVFGALPAQSTTGFPPIMPTQQQQAPTSPQPFPPQPPASYTPFTAAPQQAYQPSGWPFQPQDIRSIVREELRVREPREAEQYVDIEEPVKNAEGQVVLGPDDRPIMKHMRVPASQASQLIAPREDVEMRVLAKIGKYKELFGSKEELTMEKIRGIIREEMPTSTPAKEEKTITVEDVKSASTEAAEAVAKQILAAHEKEDKEDKRHREVISAIERSGSAKAVEGYKEDSFRILGQGLSEVAAVAKEKKPGEIVATILAGGPSTKEVEAGAGEGLIDRLKKRGWVVEQ